ncbi:hypothetical protein SISNIDRAFT_483130 [Sistotremastrum niveocremeum HHB9708]|uniref:Uncharacterized protein n=1 Tax=Sistotremastrum niveocremeum HHB9708 TaxID=1314777 RepID=A0A164Y4P2_9AGAM|nr:hypothetical protein SISNIDRAFT_483130 [Sistotremastrum niveocremeum HHB9708]
MSTDTDLRYIFLCVQNLELRVGVAASLYSILFILFLVTLRAFITQYRAQGSFELLLSMLAVTFVIPTVIFILTMINISTRLRPANSLTNFIGCNDNSDPGYLRVLFILQMFILDAFTVYRTWLIHARRIKIVVFPALLALTLLAFIPVSGTNAVSELYDIVLPLSLVLNVLCTALISIRLLHTEFEALHSSRFMILHFVIVSGALYSLLLFFLLIGQVGGWGIGISLVGPIAISSVGAITFDLLVLQLALTKAFRHQGFVPIDETGGAGSEAGTSSVEPKFTSDPVIDLVL